MAHEPSAAATLIGTSAAMRSIRQDIDLAARSNGKILITGETGVGKEVIATLIHQQGSRRLAPMAMVNCAGVPDALLESELFGHVRGSFTDAYRDKAGILESAANGTVFLDEVGEMSPRMQGALLRFLETGELQRVGADRVHAHVDVRVISATNRDLVVEMNSGRFRQDLYYRLNVVHIHVPPLRERRDDIPLLLTHFIDRYSCKYQVPRPQFGPGVMERLVARDWPGNVRQLKNVAERLVLRSDGTVRLEALADADEYRMRNTSRGERPGGRAALIDVESELLRRMIEGHESFWSVVHAPFMKRDLSRSQLRGVVEQGLSHTGGSYRQLVRLFNMAPEHYKRFLSFLQNHECHVPFRTFRMDIPRPLPAPREVSAA
jgi:transcriptional regulator with GAF, ATPase, and Fis domain